MILKDKLKALTVHLLGSIGIALLLSYVVFYIWYPTPLPKATGITQIFIMMLMIDVIIGPVLTFLIYKKGKKTLKFDLAVIVILQLCAMLYGMYFVSQGRPAWLVQVNDRVVMVSPSVALDSQNNSIANQFYAQNWGKPKFVSVAFSDDVQTRNEQLDWDIAGRGIVYQPSGYAPYDANQSLSNASDVRSLEKYNPKTDVENALSRYPNAKYWLPLRGADMAGDLVVLLDEQGGVVGVVDLKPWE